MYITFYQKMSTHVVDFNVKIFYFP